MGYLEQCLIDGERILYRARLHWIVILREGVIALCADLLGIALILVAFLRHAPDESPSSGFIVTGALLLVAGGAVFAAGLIRRNATEIAVTNRRILIKTGIVTRRTTELLLSKVESIGVDETVFGRVLGYGTVILRGTGGTPEPFDRIANPLEFRRQIQSQLAAGARRSEELMRIQAGPFGI